MSIDGIGRPPAPPSGVNPLGEATAPASSGEAFEVQRSGGAAASVGASGLLGRLEGGELSFDQYLEARVDEAVGPLAGRLPAEQLEFVRETLRSQLESDPVLVELARRVSESTASAQKP